MSATLDYHYFFTMRSFAGKSTLRSLTVHQPHDSGCSEMPYFSWYLHGLFKGTGSTVLHRFHLGTSGDPTVCYHFLPPHPPSSLIHFVPTIKELDDVYNGLIADNPELLKDAFAGPPRWIQKDLKEKAHSSILLSLQGEHTVNLVVSQVLVLDSILLKVSKFTLNLCPTTMLHLSSL